MNTDSETRRQRLLRWRDWPLVTKLGAVMLIPVIFAITLGVSQIRGQVESAGDYARVERVLDTQNRVEPLLNRLQDERTTTVQHLTGDVGQQEVQADVDAADEALGQLRAFIDSPDEFGSIVGSRYADMNRALGQLQELRAGVRSGAVGPDQAIDGYSTIVTSVLSMDRALASTVADERLSSHAAALQDLLVMMEEVRVQQVWALTGLGEGQLNQRALQELQSSRARLLNKIEEAGATVAPYWQGRLQTTVNSPEISQRNQMLMMIVAESLDDEYTGSYSVSTGQWNQRSDDSIRLIADGHSELSGSVRSTAEQLQDQASDRAGWISVGLLTALIAASWLITVITRQLLRSLRELRRGALNSAEQDLPEAVRSIREGDRRAVQLEPLPVSTEDEVGQVARAFDEVNQQALRLAIEQATLRRGFNEAFVSVSRRSQSLLERQLRVFEELEQDEEDPDQLARLFQLDHLATRMRRNNENLMVLSGSDLVRRFTQPTDITQILRAAVSEIEQYPRVVLQPAPSVQLRGHVASDLVRLFAELLDNATGFSAPDTTVSVACYQAGDGSVVVDVLDTGIGMSDEEVARANERLAQVDENDLASSRRMGLFVAGRLAARHDVGVQLHGGSDVEGMRAMVTVPAENVVTDGSAATWTPPASATPPGQRNGHAPSLSSSGLPGTPLDADPAAGTPAGGPSSSGPNNGGPFTPPPEAPAERSPGMPPVGPAQQSPGMPPVGSAQAEEPPAPSSDLPQRRPAGSAEAERSAQPPEPSTADNSSASAAESPEETTGRLFEAPLDLSRNAGAVGSDSTTTWSNGPELPQRTPRSARSRNAAAQGEGEAIPEVSTEWFQPAGENPYFQNRQQQPEQESAGEEFAWPDESDWPAAAGGGSSDDEAPQETSEHDAARSAGEVSRRIADLHNGVRFQRAHTGHDNGGGQPASSASAEAPTGSGGAVTGSAEESEANGAGWGPSSLDEAQRAAEAAVNPEPSSYTRSGLPRRTPKAHLVPGSAQNDNQQASDEQESAPQRDAEQLRSRLSSFQSGVRSGRHRAGGES
ncbi:sensor histidine kinase [Bounagaea algeriensis]